MVIIFLLLSTHGVLFKQLFYYVPLYNDISHLAMNVVDKVIVDFTLA